MMLPPSDRLPAEALREGGLPAEALREGGGVIVRSLG
jgi:hypothetical protein